MDYGSTPGLENENRDRISIRAGNLNEVFIGENGKLMRGVMVAYNQQGKEIARGATYQEFMESLRRNGG